MSNEQSTSNNDMQKTGIPSDRKQPDNPVPVTAPGGAMELSPSSSKDSVNGSGDAGASAVVGASGGTDAAAGAQRSGSKGGPGGPDLRELTDNAAESGAPGDPAKEKDISPAAGANAAGGTGLDAASTIGTAPRESSGF